jgi:hypothetical protein
MSRNSVGVGPSAARGHVTRISLFHRIPAVLVIPLIPGTMFRNSGGVGRWGIPDGGTITYRPWQRNETQGGLPVLAPR